MAHPERRSTLRRHDNERPALIHQHATNAADQAIAQGLDALLKTHRDDGPAGVLVPVA